jgi:hypothetical protein
MRRTVFDEKRDMAAAEDVNDRRELMCAAHGCPNPWSLLSSRLCRWHSAAAPHMWPIVTREAQDAMVARQNRQPVEVKPLSREDKTAILQKLRVFIARRRLS